MPWMEFLARLLHHEVRARDLRFLLSDYNGRCEMNAIFAEWRESFMLGLVSRLPQWRQPQESHGGLTLTFESSTYLQQPPRRVASRLIL
jgi:hypothetical protein